MFQRKPLIILLMFLLFVFALPGPGASAKDREYSAIVNHLKKKYQAKKTGIPFLWVARFAVKIVRPAGVKSFNVTLFENLKFTRETLDEEMQAAMRNSLSEDWQPLIRVRSSEGEQVYAYAREAGNDIKLMLVTIDRQEAVVVRAKFSPKKLVEFMENPKILGISLKDDKDKTKIKSEDEKPIEEAKEVKPEERKATDPKDN